MFPPLEKLNLCLFIIFYIYAILLILAFSVVWAFANTDPILAALKVFTIGAGGINCTLGVPLVAPAGILHHGHKRRSIIRVNRVLYKVGVDHVGIVLSVTFSVVTVSEFKGPAISIHYLVKIPFLRDGLLSCLAHKEPAHHALKAPIFLLLHISSNTPFFTSKYPKIIFFAIPHDASSIPCGYPHNIIQHFLGFVNR